MERNDRILINSAQLEEKILEQVCKFSLWNMDRGEKFLLTYIMHNVTEGLLGMSDRGV